MTKLAALFTKAIEMRNTIITGTGSYIPTNVVPNRAFVDKAFYNKDHSKIDQPGEVVTRKFAAITGIQERRYADPDQQTSDIATLAAEKAIQDAGVDRETLDHIIIAHNFGDVIKETIQTDVLPSLASRVKHKLGIQNPGCVAFDVMFGCPGWIQGVIIVDSFIKSGIAKRALVVGAETLSRVVDPYDRDSMIFSDGAGASIIEAAEEDQPRGILSQSVVTHTVDEAFYLYLGASCKPNSDDKVRYIKMDGRKIYNYALTHVPAAMKTALDKAGLDIKQVKKIFLHQANEKMDHAIITRLFELYGVPETEQVMPMSISQFGNSSVATVPTLYDLVRKGEQPEHELNPGDIILFASVGAGMNINAIAYKV